MLLFQNEVNERELTALKAVVKCIEEHKLEGRFSVDPLQKRIVQMEKVKAEKKRVTETTKPQSKRPRAGGPGPRIIPAAAATATDKAFYPRVADNRYPQYVYERPYIYAGPTEGHCPAIMGSPAAYGLSPGPPPGNYFPNGYQYQTAYLH